MNTAPLMPKGVESEDDIFDTEGAARFLGCSASKLSKARVHGNGPVYIKDGRSVRFIRLDLKAYRNRNKRRSTCELAEMPARIIAVDVSAECGTDRTADKTPMHIIRGHEG